MPKRGLMSIVLKKVTCLATAVVAVLMFGCSSSGGRGEAASGADRTGGSEAGVPGELDQRVIEAVVPVSGESMPSARWLDDELHAARIPPIRACLEERGRLDLLEMVELQREVLERRGWDPFLYPEPELLLANGLGGEKPGLPDEFLTGMLSGDESSDGGVVATCLEEAAGDPALTGIRGLQEVLGSDWAQVVEDVSYDDGMTSYYEDFAFCLRAEGVPDEAATGSPGDYIVWAEGQRMSLDAGEAQARGMEQARLYVECGEEMFQARADKLGPEREAFLESHRDQIEELTELLVGLGLG